MYLCSPFEKKSIKSIITHHFIPAIVYGGGTTQAIAVTPKAVKPLIYTPDFKLAEISAGGESYTCILKDITFHPVSDEIVHIDFLRTIEGNAIKVEIPVKYKGKSPGVKGGGKLITQMRKVKVKTMPNPVALVEIPRALKSAAAAEEKEEGAAADAAPAE